MCRRREPGCPCPVCIPDAVSDCRDELERQKELWGEQNWPDGTGSDLYELAADIAKTDCELARERGILTWEHILFEELCEAMAESDPALLRAELIQVAAVALQWAGAIDRRAV